MALKQSDLDAKLRQWISNNPTYNDLSIKKKPKSLIERQYEDESETANQQEASRTAAVKNLQNLGILDENGAPVAETARDRSLSDIDSVDDETADVSSDSKTNNNYLGRALAFLGSAASQLTKPDTSGYGDAKYNTEITPVTPDTSPSVQSTGNTASPTTPLSPTDLYGLAKYNMAPPEITENKSADNSIDKSTNLYGLAKYDMAPTQTEIDNNKNNFASKPLIVQQAPSQYKETGILPGDENKHNTFQQTPSQYKETGVLPGDENKHNTLQQTPSEFKQQGVYSPDPEAKKGTSWSDVLYNTFALGQAQLEQGQANVARLALKALGNKEINNTADNSVNNIDQKINEYNDQLKNLTGAKQFVSTGLAAVPQIVATGIEGQGLGTVLGLTGKALGAVRMIPFGVTAGGGYADQARQDGASTGQQVAYGFLGGLAEAATEMPFMNKWVDLAGGKFIDSGAKTLIGRYGKQGLNYIKNVFGEAYQEAIVDPITGFAKAATYDPSIPLVGAGGIFDVSQMSQDAYGGAAMAVMLSALGLPSNMASHVLARNYVNSGKIPSQEELNQIDTQTDADVDTIEKHTGMNLKENGQLLDSNKVGTTPYNDSNDDVITQATNELYPQTENADNTQQDNQDNTVPNYDDVPTSQDETENQPGNNSDLNDSSTENNDITGQKNSEQVNTSIDDKGAPEASNIEAKPYNFEDSIKNKTNEMKSIDAQIIKNKADGIETAEGTLKRYNSLSLQVDLEKAFNDYAGDDKEITDEINDKGYDEAKTTYVDDFLANNHKKFDDTNAEVVKNVEDLFDKRFSSLKSQEVKNGPITELNNSENTNTSETTETAPETSTMKPEIQKQLDEIDAETKDYIDSINNSNWDDVSKSKQLKAIGMQQATKKRKVIQGDSLEHIEGGFTALELQRAREKQDIGKIQKQLDELDQETKTMTDTVKNSNWDDESKGKQLKAIGMRQAAKKRRIIQNGSLEAVEGGLTPIELQGAINKEKSNYVGKEVTTPNGDGVIIGNSFGKVIVKFKDNTTKTFDKKDVLARKPKEEVKNTKKEEKANTENTKSETNKIGRKGKAEFQKRGRNEWVNADLDDPNDPYTIAYKQFFDYWYNMGLKGEKQIFNNLTSFGGYNFPTFLEDVFFNAGKTDANKTETTTKTEETNKKTENKRGALNFKVGDIIKSDGGRVFEVLGISEKNNTFTVKSVDKWQQVYTFNIKEPSNIAQPQWKVLSKEEQIQENLHYIKHYQDEIKNRPEVDPKSWQEILDWYKNNLKKLQSGHMEETNKKPEEKPKTETDEYTEKEKIAIDNFVTGQSNFYNKQYKDAGNKVTEDVIKHNEKYAMDAAKLILRKIKEKDFHWLLQSMRKDNPFYLKMFTEITGIPIDVNNIKYGIRKLDSIEFDKWANAHSVDIPSETTSNKDDKAITETINRLKDSFYKAKNEDALKEVIQNIKDTIKNDENISNINKDDYINYLKDLEKAVKVKLDEMVKANTPEEKPETKQEGPAETSKSDLLDTITKLGDKITKAESLEDFAKIINKINDVIYQNEDLPETDSTYIKLLKSLRDNAKGRYDKLVKANAPEEQPAETKPAQELSYSITKTKDTRDQRDLWVVKFKEKSYHFANLKRQMKDLGGMYSRFTHGFNFYFDPTEKLNEFLGINKETAPETKTEEKTPEIENEINMDQINFTGKKVNVLINGKVTEADLSILKGLGYNGIYVYYLLSGNEIKNNFEYPEDAKQFIKRTKDFSNLPYDEFMVKLKDYKVLNDKGEVDRTKLGNIGFNYVKDSNGFADLIKNYKEALSNQEAFQKSGIEDINKYRNLTEISYNAEIELRKNLIEYEHANFDRGNQKIPKAPNVLDHYTKPLIDKLAVLKDLTSNNIEKTIKDFYTGFGYTLKKEAADNPVKTNSRENMSAADMAADYKARGMDKYRAWDQFIIDKQLKPGMNAKDFYSIYESVTPKLFKDIEIKGEIKPTHILKEKGIDTPKEVQILENTDDYVKWVTKNGMTGSTPKQYVESLTPIGENVTVKSKGSVFEKGDYVEFEGKINKITGFKIDKDLKANYIILEQKDDTSNRNFVDYDRFVSDYGEIKGFNPYDFSNKKGENNNEVKTNTSGQDRSEDRGDNSTSEPSTIPTTQKEGDINTNSSENADSSGTGNGQDRTDTTGPERQGQSGIHGEGSNDEHVPSTSGKSSSEGINRELEQRNFRITPTESKKTFNQKENYKNNVNAIKTLQHIEAEGRYATPEEQEILSKYAGWGGIPQVFDNYNDKWTNEYNELRDLLLDDDYKAARASTLNAHYTADNIIQGIYRALDRLGFKGGSILEPAMGTGKFFGLLPDNMIHSRLTGVELDNITGKIAKQLYQTANIKICGFEKLVVADNFFDGIVGNVPFGEYELKDKKYKNLLVHDYFIMKSLDKVKPGGVVAIITSKGTLDKANSSTREMFKEKADLIGAIRLPNTAFKGNAGTSVTSDILFFKKRAEGETPSGENFINIGNTEDHILLNEYFIKHPEMMLGTMKMVSTQYGYKSDLVADDRDLNKAIDEAIQKLPKNIIKPDKNIGTEELKPKDIIPIDDSVKVGSFGLHNGIVIYNTGKEFKPVAQNIELVKDGIKLIQTTQKLLRNELDNVADNVITASMNELNRAYDNFISKYGLIGSKKVKQALKKDNDYSLIASLEGKEGIKSKIFTERVLELEKEITHVDTAKDGLVVSMNVLGRLDLNKISQLTGKSVEECIEELNGLIYKNPNNGQYETSDEYLSGNVRVKLLQAENAAKNDNSYKENVEALKIIQPKDLEAHEINVKLGSTWIEPSDIRDFICQLLDVNKLYTDNIHIEYGALNSEWVVSLNGLQLNNAKNEMEWGTDRIDAIDLIEQALNFKTPTVFDYDDDVKVLNKKATAAARDKMGLIKKEFKRWIFDDVERRNRLVKKYNTEYNNIRKRVYEGSYLTFPGMSKLIKLLDHQAAAVARIVQSGNTLLAHVVGGGKTYTMQTAGMELKRLGLIKKPMYVIPNSMIKSGQFANEFKSLYPNANILACTTKDFEKSNRAILMARIATGNWDAVIISHSQFGKIPVSLQTKADFVEKQIDEVIEAIREAEANGDSSIVKKLEATRKKLEDKYDALMNTVVDNGVTFEELGVDQIFVDEAHNFKNLFLVTKMTRVAGIQTTDAKKTSDLLMKIRYIQDINNGRGVVFATGTPISNTMAELYTMQKYLQPELLEQYGLQSFDAWAANFGDIVSNLEVTPTGVGYRSKASFSEFSNIPELISMFSNVADIKLQKDLNLKVPVLEGGKPIITENERSDFAANYIAELIERADAISNGNVDPSDDNMLKVTNEGRKLAVDPRLIDPNAPDKDNSKLNMAVDNIYKEWKNTKAEKGTQLVFCDLGTPKKGVKPLESLTDEQREKLTEDEILDYSIRFNVYDDIKKKLVKLGIPANEIAFIHDSGTSDVKRANMLDAVRNGDIRILIGSTPKMGEGMNVQDRMSAIHEVDCPWRPADIEQREGRLLRQGNMYYELGKPVRVYRYATKATFDAYSWQKVESKAKFIAQIMSGDTSVRVKQDISGTALSAAEMKIASSDNPLIKEKFDVDAKVSTLQMAKDEFTKNKYRMQDQIIQYKSNIKQDEIAIKKFEQDITTRDSNATKEFEITIGDDTYTDKEEAYKAIVAIADNLDKYDSRTGFAKYNGFPLDINRGVKKDEIYIDIEGKQVYGIHVSASAVGTFEKLKNQLNDIDELISDRKEYIEGALKNITNNEKLLEKPFGREKELSDLVERQIWINNQLNLDKVQDNNQDINDNSDDENSDDDTQAFVGSTKGKKNNISSDNSDLVQHKEILDDLMKVLDIPLRKGRVSKKNALGVFKPHSEVIRTKQSEDTEVSAHEIGHYLDKLYGLTKIALNNERICEELMNLGKEQAKLQKLKKKGQIKEGIAEFVRKYLHNEHTGAPLFEATFEELLKQDTKLYNAMQMFRHRIAAYDAAEPKARIKSKIQFAKRKTKLQKVSEFKQNATFTKFNEELFNKESPLKDLTRHGVVRSIFEDPYTMARAFRGWVSKAESMLRYGVYKEVNGEMQEVQKPLFEILKSVSNDMENFAAYCVAKRVIEKENQGINTGFDLKDAESVYNEYKDNKTFNTAHAELQEYQDSLLRQLVDSGIMSEDIYDKIKIMNDDYVPFYRVLDTEKGAAQKYMGEAFANLRNPVMKMMGDNGSIVNPIESIVKNTYYFTNISERNKVGLALVAFSKENDGLGKFIERVSPIMKPTSFDLDSIKKTLDEAGADIDDMDLEKIATIFRPLMKGKASERTVIIYEDGKPKIYQLSDDIYRAMTLTGDNGHSWLVTFLLKLLTAPARILRAGAVLNPDFAIKNPGRDTFTAAIYSKYGFVPILDTIKGIFHVLKKDEIFKLWLNSSGGSSDMSSLDIDYLGNDLKKLMMFGESGNFIRKSLNSLQHPFQTLRELSDIAEQGTRVGDFAKGIKKEGRSLEGITKAGLESRDITLDFAGGGHLSKSANKYVAFFNATLLGSDKLMRTFISKDTPKDQKMKALFKALMYVTVPSILLWILFHDDPEIKALPGWRKNLCWNIPIGGKVLSIPKPFELGIIFGSLPERALDFLVENDNNAMPGWGMSLFQGVTPNVIPTAIQPILEMIFNYSFFTGRPIENEGDKGVDPSQRYNSYTSELAKLIGNAANISPKMIDNTIAGYGGGLGKWIVGAAGSAIDSGNSNHPASILKRIPGISGIVAEPYSQDENINQYYANKNQSQQSYDTAARKYKAIHPVSEKTWSSMVRSGALPTADLRKWHKINSTFTDFDKKMKSYSDQETLIINNTKMSAAEKQIQVNKLNMQKDLVTVKFNQQYDKLTQKK